MGGVGVKSNDVRFRAEADIDRRVTSSTPLVNDPKRASQQKAALHEKTLQISRSTRESVRSIGKDENNGSQGQTTRHEQVAGSAPRPERPLPRRVERIPARTQRAVGGGGRTPAAERGGRRPAPGTPSGRPHQGGLRLRVRGRWQRGAALGVVRTG